MNDATAIRRTKDSLTSAVQKGLRQQSGVSLLELLLAAGIIAAGTAIVFNVYKNVNASSNVDRESVNLRNLTQNVLNSYSSSSDFSSLTTERAIEEKLFPSTMLNPGEEPTSIWGKPVRVIATDIERDGSILPDRGFVISYDKVPPKACIDLITQAGSEFHDIRVENTSVGSGSTFNLLQAGQLCNRAGGANVQFIFERQSLVASTTNLALCSDSLPGAPENQTIACPAGEYGLVTQSREAFCVSAQGPFQWTSWSTTSSTCVPCPTPENRNTTQTIACPPGQDGTWIQTRTESRSANCPLAGSTGPTESFEWHDWTATSNWSTVTNSCAPICEPPNPSLETRWVSASSACAPGTAGTISWQQEEQRVASCPPTTPGSSHSTGSYTWSDWTITGNRQNLTDTCETCPTPETRQTECPAGQAGQIVQERSYLCEGEGGWSSWTTTSNNCSPCPAPQSETLACPAGQVGTITRSREFNCAVGQGWGDWTITSNTCADCPTPETRSSDCPTGEYGFISESRSFLCGGSQGSWGTWTPNSNNCSTCPSPAVENQTAACPSIFHTGSKLQQRSRTFQCTGTGGWNEWSAWTTTADTCDQPVCDNTLEGNAKNYLSRYPDLVDAFVPTAPDAPINYNQVYAHWNTSGFQEGRASCWSNPNTPCVRPTPSVQTEVEKQTFTRTLNCPAGQVGEINQIRQPQRTRQRTASCPSSFGSFHWGNWTNWTVWTNPGWTTTSNTCYTPCVNSVQTEKQTDTEYKTTTLICWYGWSGSESTQYITSTRAIERSRTRDLICTAPTSPAQPQAWSNWSNWYPISNWNPAEPTCPWGTVRPW